jgi:hypothetical protein
MNERSSAKIAVHEPGIREGYVAIFLLYYDLAGYRNVRWIPNGGH